MKILVLIPSKLDSKRLPLKNIRKIHGKTLLEYSIDYAKASSHDVDIYVSSEDDRVKEIAVLNGVNFIPRDEDLCGDVEVVDVYVNILGHLDKKYDLVVALQPDHPDREHSFDFCIDYFVKNNYDDLITIESNFKRSGSVRIFKYKYLVSGKVSYRIGTIKDDATDIHYKEDLLRAEKRLR